MWGLKRLRRRGAIRGENEEAYDPTRRTVQGECLAGSSDQKLSVEAGLWTVRIFSLPAFRRMFERVFSPDEEREVITTGETIADYPEGKPFPS